MQISEAATGVGDSMADVGMATQRALDKTETMKARAEAVDELQAAGTFEELTALLSHPSHSDSDGSCLIFRGRAQSRGKRCSIIINDRTNNSASNALQKDELTFPESRIDAANYGSKSARRRRNDGASRSGIAGIRVGDGGVSRIALINYIGHVVSPIKPKERPETEHPNWSGYRPSR